ncbi:putative short-chain dehydrogenase/reductase SDR, NAD(P)-binding domain superfamily [Acrodontium crateriforme]|uniref:Short-chain dehydrogenase/reductase SDR, NAD(P)-binding domain superfamily n=1 Tax=Acrodontium crateriforme TaxID=150365 RepID=A0AAQ3M9C0_9PEZI|nr:putative short-chain dehydrogenase/reductase SDR, NAD(P)-binding domain superfamily [Acrodontium crateriforme]
MQLCHLLVLSESNMPGRLTGRTALVTGGSSGLGRAICLAFAADGANICCVDLYESPRNKTNPTTGKADDYHNRIEGESTAQELQRLYGVDRAVFVHADVTVATSIEAAVSKCVKAFGRLDIMMNNAGISLESTHARPLGIHETSEEDWDRTLAINAKGVFLGCKYALIQMLKQEHLPGVKDRGWIVNTASIQGLVAYHNTPAYTASKGAVAQLTKQVALDYAPHRVHCNSICPGFLKTAMTQNLQNSAELRAEIDARHPFGGMGDPNDVAKAALFLASDDVAWMTGVNLPVDGGYMIM